MTEEDEAFEDLAKRQGDWGMQGSRKHQILRYAENVESKGTSMTDKEAKAMAQEKALQALHNENERLGLYRDAYTEQEPVAHLWECLGRWSAYLVNNGTQAECAPPSWLVEAVKNATTPPAQPAPVQEPLTFAGLAITEIRLPTGMTSRFEGGVLIIEAAQGIGEKT